MLLRTLEGGTRIAIAGEVDPAAYERVLRSRPAVRDLFDPLRVEPASEARDAGAGGTVGRAPGRARGARARPPLPAGRAARRRALAAAPRRRGRGRHGRARRRRGALRPAAVAARRARADGRRRAAALLRDPRGRPARGGRRGGRAGRAGQGGAGRPDAPAGGAAVRRADRHGQDRDRQGARGVPVRVARPHDPRRPERVPELRQRPPAARRGRVRRSLAGRHDPAPAVLGRAARRVREGRSRRLGPLPAGVRRRPAVRPARRGRGLPPRRDHHDLEPGGEDPDRRRDRLQPGVGLHGRQRHPGGDASVPARVPEPDRSRGRLPASVTPGDARHPRGRAERGAGAARPALARLGGRVGRLGARVPLDGGLHARPRRAAAQARGGAPLPDAAGARHRRARLPGGRPVPVRARGRDRPRGDVRRPRRAGAGGGAARGAGLARRAGPRWR